MSSTSSSTQPPQSSSTTPQQPQLQLNPRGIPHAPFITNVQEHLGGPDQDVEPTLRKFQETMSKYKFMEMNTAQRRGGLEDKIPDIRKTLQMVQFLKQSQGNPEPIKTTFELNETLFAKAQLEQTDKVHLWLGANVMLSYPIDEAIQLLSTKLQSAETSLVAAKEDLDFLREQITIMEVNTARVHNWDVKRRRERREQLESQGISAGRGATAKASTWLQDDNDDAAQPDAPAVQTAQTVAVPKSADEVDPASAKSSDPAALPASAPSAAPVAASAPPQVTTVPPPATSPAPPPEVSSHPPLPPLAPSTSTLTPAVVPAGPSPGSNNTARAPNPGPAPSLQTHLQSNQTVVPPLNFDMVSPGVYRSGHPNERNFGFLKRLNLKSVMYLANEEYRTNMTTWAQNEGIRIFHFKLDLNKEPLAEMDAKMVTAALLMILDPTNLPILIHCNKGKYRVGCITGLLRRLQGWSHTSIFEEYARFAGSRIADTEFIEMFELKDVYTARMAR